VAGRSASETVGSPEMAHIGECRALPPWAKTSVVGEGTGHKQPADSPGSLRATCHQGTVDESSEPLTGREGAPAIAKASRISRQAAKSRCACEWGGWGRISVDGPGQNNPDRSEGPWGRADKTARTVALHPSPIPPSSGGVGLDLESAKGADKPQVAKGMPGAGLTGAARGKDPPDRPALKPYWGKPAVRNFRGAGGNGATGRATRARSWKRRTRPSASLWATAPLAYPANLLVRFWRGASEGNDRGLLYSGS
jgi:hypothetical protein